MDSTVDTGGGDTGASCDRPCSPTERCCGDDGGALMCINTVDDPLNCGGCDVVCADGRGTECQRSNCICGRVEMGCLGTDRSYCCPPRSPGGVEYCADFTTDSQDCGSCGNECALEQSSACRLGECVCGDTTSPCAGTPEDTCCAAAATGVSTCVDTTSDFFHCGGCGRPCMTGERCEMSTCVIGGSCPGACEGTEVCCDGACCERISCERGEC